MSEHDCITFDGLDSPEVWTFTTRKGEASVAIHSRLTVTMAEAAIDAAVAGSGVPRVLSYEVADAIRSGKLVGALCEF